MNLFELTKDERRHYIATLLNCNPDDQSSWPTAVIDRILEDAEHAAEQRISEDVWRLMGRVVR